MSYGSRRWTGRIVVDPRKEPMTRPARYRHVRWLLVLVIGISLGVAVMQVALPGTDRTDALAHLAILFAGFGAASGCSSFARSRWRDYDEFERTVLMRAHRRAYGVTVALVMIAFTWCTAAVAQGWPMPRHPFDWLVWAASLLVISSNLPVILAKFAIPFPDQAAPA